MKEVRLKRMLAGALAAALALGAAPAALAAEPQVQVRAANIDNEYLEIGLVIPAETTMQSAAVVLTYDTAKLEPVDWSGTTVTPGGAWTDAAQLPAKGSDATTGKPALVYEDGGKGYLFLSAESAKALTVTGSTALQATTVRFRYETEKPTADTAEAIGSVTLASAEEAAGSPAGQPTLFSDGTQNVALAVPPAIIYDNAGQSIAGGGVADVSKFVPLVLYDWDGVTILGTVIASQTDTVEQAQASVNAFANANPELFEKAGYQFENVWLDLNSGAAGRYGRVADPASAAITDDNEVEVSSLFDWTQLSKGGSYALKAAYRGSVEFGLPDKSGAALNRYTTEIIGYGRYGTSSNYSVKVKVMRRSTADAPIPKTGELALRVTMTDDSKNTSYSLIKMDNTDVATAEIPVTNKVSKVAWSVVDTYNISNWVGATPRSGTTDSADRGTVESKTGFQFLGTLGYINEELSPKGTLNFTLTVLTNDLGLSYSGNLSSAKNRLQAAWREKNPDYGSATEYKDLSWDEMQEALAA